MARAVRLIWKLGMRLMAWCGGRGHDSAACHFKCQLCQLTHDETANLNKTLHNTPMNWEP